MIFPDKHRRRAKPTACCPRVARTPRRWSSVLRMTWERVPAQIQMTGFAHIRVTHTHLHKQRLSCMLESRNAKSNTCQVRREWRRGRAVALSRMNLRRTIKYQDGHGVWKQVFIELVSKFLPCYCCFSGDVKFAVGAEARFKPQPSNFCGQKRNYLPPPIAPSSSSGLLNVKAPK